jgi:hypothetical protein
MATIIEYTGDVFAVNISPTWAEHEVELGRLTRTENPRVYLLADVGGVSPRARKAAAWDARHANGPFARVIGATWDQCPIGELNVVCENA